MFGPVSDTRVEHPSINATIKIKLCIPSVLTTMPHVHVFVLAGEGRSSPLISRVNVSLLPGIELHDGAPPRCFSTSLLCRQPMGGCPARCFCAPPGVSGCDLVPMLATTLPALGKVLSAIDFEAMQLLCVVLCVFHYTKRRPAEHICIKLPMKQRLRKRCHFKNHLCIFIQSTMLTLWTHSAHTHPWSHVHGRKETPQRTHSGPNEVEKWEDTSKKWFKFVSMSTFCGALYALYMQCQNHRSGYINRSETNNQSGSSFWINKMCVLNSLAILTAAEEILADITV